MPGKPRRNAATEYSGTSVRSSATAARASSIRPDSTSAYASVLHVDACVRLARIDCRASSIARSIHQPPHSAVAASESKK